MREWLQEKVAMADKVLVEHAVTKVYDGDVILTYAYSQVCACALCACAQHSSACARALLCCADAATRRLSVNGNSSSQQQWL